MDVSLWLALASLLIGGGGLTIAIMGYLSNRKAIDDAWVREWAAQRAVVYPVLLEEWLSGSGAYQHGAYHFLLPLKNGGRGPALNVRGALTVTSDSGDQVHQILASTIAAGDLMNARLIPQCEDPRDWSSARGSITYRDLAGGTWEQSFDCTRGPQGELDLSLQEPTQTSLAAGPPAIK